MTDPRRQRSVDAIQRVFFAMVLTRRYHEITIRDILVESGVAKSTFYEIFPNKDALLAASLEGPFAILAGCVDDSPDLARLQGMIEHFWQNRGMARGLFTGSARPKITHALALQVDSRLAQRGGPLTVSRALAATAIAEMLIGTLAAWLLGRATGDPESLARGLAQTGRTAFRG